MSWLESAIASAGRVLRATLSFQAACSNLQEWFNHEKNSLVDAYDTVMVGELPDVLPDDNQEL